MDRSKLPVAKRTRSSCDRFWNCYLERAKKGKSSAAGAPVTEYEVVSSPVECVNVDWEEDESLESRNCGSKSKSTGKETEKDGHASVDCDVVEMLESGDDGEVRVLSDEESDSDVVVMSVVDKKGSEDERLVVDDDVREDVAVDDKLSDSSSSEDVNYYSEGSDETYREENNGSSRSDDHDESLDESSSFDKSEDEGEDDSDVQVVQCRIWEKNDVKCKGKWKGKGKGKGETVVDRIKDKVVTFEQEESSSCNDESDDEDEKRFCSLDDDTDEEIIASSKYETSVGRNKGKRIVKSAFMKRTQNAAVRLRSNSLVNSGSENVSSRKDGLQIHSLAEADDQGGGEYVNKYGGRRPKILKMATRPKPDKDLDAEQMICNSSTPREVRNCDRSKMQSDCSRGNHHLVREAEEVVEILSSSESDEESGGKYVRRDGGESPRKNLKMATKRKEAGQNLDGLTILADSLHGKGEALKKFEKEKPRYKFWFKGEDEKRVEKSDFDEHVDGLFKELNMCLTFEQIGSTPLEVVDNGDHCKTQTDWATLCSQGIHHLVLDEQIGIICKYCSHVNQEIKHILPDFSKPSSQTRRRGYFVQSGCPIYSDDFRYSGAGTHDSEIYNTTGTVWDLVPGTRSSMYEHQREGFEFIWKNLAGGIIIDELEKPLLSSGSGCIISHAPGTGKTRLTIIFLQSFMKLYPDSRPVIIAPKSMLLTWEEEFKKWNINMPFHNLNNMEFSGQENPAAVSVSREGRNSRNSETRTRLVKLLSWKMEKSILGLTYALFDKLVRDATKNADCSPLIEQMGKALLKLPSLIVLDEGHTPRNDQSSIYNSLLDVGTERRIILSGTPFQNNFDELYNTLRLVNPKFDCEMKKNLRNISKELKTKWSGHKLRELKCMISPFVHVHKGKILQKSCPGLKDALIYLQPTELQQELIGVLSTNDLKAGYLELSYVTSLVSVHPSLLPKRYFQERQFSSYRDKLEKLESDPYSGAKTKFVVELCRLSEALNEKVLIYSQYIDPLIFTKKQLQTYFGWTEGREVLYMDGGLEAKQRQSLITSLNDPRSKVRVLLASIKACSEGINLVGASRVVLLDVVWNPSVERQAISRAYRIGQKKIVHTYHLIGEEMDSKKYEVQTAKDRLSEIVFSSDDMDSCKENVPSIVSEDEILQKMFQHNDKLGGMFKKIIYQPKESNLVDTYDLVAEVPNL